MVTKVMVSFPEEFLDEIDRIARQEHRSRSELLREAMRLYISTRKRKARPREDPRVQQAIEMQDRLSHLTPGIDEDSAQDIRRWRDLRGGLEEGLK